MDSRLSFNLIALLCIYNQSAGKLIQVPRNTTAKVNQSTYFNCSTSLVAREIFWYHGKSSVSTGEDFYDGYNGRMSLDVDNATRACNLVIHSVQLSDAGEYRCEENEGDGEKGSAQLTVLDGDPICQSNVELNDVIGQNTCNFNKDEVQLSCSVKFNGNIPPDFEWKKIEDDINIGLIGNISKMTYGNIHKSTLILGNDVSIHESAYICQITGTTDNQYKCTSEMIRLFYSVDSGEAVTAIKGAHLTCVANTTFNCKYRWFRGNDSICPVSCNQHLTADFLGDYHCEAKCTVRRKDCTFVAMKVFVTPEPERLVETIIILGLPALVAIGILGTCLIGAIGVAIFLYLNPRKKPRNFEEAMKSIEFAFELVLHAGEQEKEEFLRKSIKKTRRDPSAQLSISQMMETCKQMNLIFNKLETSQLSMTVPHSSATETGREQFHESQPQYCEIAIREKGDGNVYTSIEKTSCDNEQRRVIDIQEIQNPDAEANPRDKIEHLPDSHPEYCEIATRCGNDYAAIPKTSPDDGAKRELEMQQVASTIM